MGLIICRTSGGSHMEVQIYRVIGLDPRHGVGCGPHAAPPLDEEQYWLHCGPAAFVCDGTRRHVHRLPLLSSPPYVQCDRSMPHAPCPVSPRCVLAPLFIFFFLTFPTNCHWTKGSGFVRNDELSAAKTTSTYYSHAWSTCTRYTCIYLYSYASDVSFIHIVYSQLDLWRRAVRNMTVSSIATATHKILPVLYMWFYFILFVLPSWMAKRRRV
jgi:hypothetical protein